MNMASRKYDDSEPEIRKCAFCGTPFPVRKTRNNKRQKYCKASCKVRAWKSKNLVPSELSRVMSHLARRGAQLRRERKAKEQQEKIK